MPVYDLTLRGWIRIERRLDLPDRAYALQDLLVRWAAAPSKSAINKFVSDNGLELDGPARAVAEETKDMVPAIDFVLDEEGRLKLGTQEDVDAWKQVGVEVAELLQPESKQDEQV